MRRTALILAFVILVIFAADSFAAGITPAFKYLKFEPGKEQKILLNVINNEEKDAKVILTAGGDLADYIYFEENNFTMKKTEASREVVYTLSMPDQLSPGSHTAKISLQLKPEDDTESLLYSQPVLINQLIIGVPQQGTHCELKVNPLELQGKTYLYVSVYNFGTLDVEKSRAKLTIMEEDEIIHGFDEQKSAIPSQSEHVFRFNMPSEKIGVYTIDIDAFCDSQDISASQDYEIGTPGISVLDVQDNEYIAGEKGNLSLKLVSDWNTPIDVLWAYSIRSLSGEYMQEQKEPASFELLPGQEKWIEAGFDVPKNEGQEFELGFTFIIDNKKISFDHQISASGDVLMQETPKTTVFPDDDQENGKFDKFADYLWVFGFLFVVLCGSVLALYLRVPKKKEPQDGDDGVN